MRQRKVERMMRLSRPRAVTGRYLLGIVLLAIASSLVLTGCDRLTGGGWINSLNVVSGGRATFAFSARCRDTTVGGVPVAELYDGQFQFDDRGFNPVVWVHGDVDPNVFGTVPGETCRQVASETELVPLSGFQGTFRTKPGVFPVGQGEFSVAVFDGGEGQSIDDDVICVDLAGGVTYTNCGPVRGGNIQVD
jgi:hypothetical protein